MFHSVLYSSTPAGAVSRSSVNIFPGAADYVQNNQFFPPQDMRLLMASASGVTLTEMLISTPSLRSVAPLIVRPIQQATLNVTDQNVADYTDNPIFLRASENIDVEQTDPTGTTLNSFTLHMEVFKESFATGPRYVTRATAAVTLTAGAYNTITPTYDVNLPTGIYEVQNFAAVGATIRLARIIIPNNPWRPGVLGQPSLGNRQPFPNLYRHLGPMGRFNTLAYPQFEVWASAADTAQTFFLTLCKIL